MPKLLILSAALLLALNLSAAVERHALVIGNANYQSSPLRNPLNDARDMAAALKGLGFQVQSLLDADAGQMEQAILDFGDRLRTGGVGLFYYAGHGVQAQGSNYLIPLQANISREIQLKRKAIDAGLVLDAMGAANNGLNIVILDACRDNPYANSFRNTTRGLARMDSPKGSLIAYATAPGDVADDGEGRNGVFTKHLLEQMQKPGVQVEQVFKQVTQAVHAETRQRQTPFMTSSLLGDFYFKPTSASVSATTPAPKPAPAPAPTTQTTPSTIDGLSLADWLLVYGDNAITIASLDKVVAYERQHGGNAASRSYINRGLQVALANVNSADDLLEYQSKFGYLPGAPAQIEARLAELLAAGASREDLIRLRGQFPASATLRLQLAGEYHQAKLFDAAASEYQSWLGLTDSSHPERKSVLEALVAAREGRLLLNLIFREDYSAYASNTLPKDYVIVYDGQGNSKQYVDSYGGNSWLHTAGAKSWSLSMRKDFDEHLTGSITVEWDMQAAGSSNPSRAHGSLATFSLKGELLLAGILIAYHEDDKKDYASCSSAELKHIETNHLEILRKQWNTYRMDIDFNSGKFDGYVNGELLCFQYSMPKPNLEAKWNRLSKKSSIVFDSRNPTSTTTLFDNISIWQR